MKPFKNCQQYSYIHGPKNYNGPFVPNSQEKRRKGIKTMIRTLTNVLESLVHTERIAPRPLLGDVIGHIVNASSDEGSKVATTIGIETETAHANRYPTGQHLISEDISLLKILSESSWQSRRGSLPSLHGQPTHSDLTEHGDMIAFISFVEELIEDSGLWPYDDSIVDWELVKDRVLQHRQSLSQGKPFKRWNNADMIRWLGYMRAANRVR